MKSRLLPALLTALLALAPLTRVLAQPAQGAPAAPTATAPATPAQTAFKQLFEKISAKLQAGQRSAEALAAELQAFDALVAQYRQSEPNEAAMIMVMKARLYLEVFDQPAQAITLLKQIKVDFPASPIAGNIDQVVASLEAKQTAEASLAVGKVFPTFAEKDVNGQPLDLATYRGKVVLIDFWATWCGPCVAELPNVIAAYEKYHGQGFEIIGISLDQDREKLTTFLKGKNMPWRQYFDDQGGQNKLATQYGIDAIPATFLLDGTGKIVAKGMRGEELDRQLAKLLAK